jgi:hypothetical protein
MAQVIWLETTGNLIGVADAGEFIRRTGHPTSKDDLVQAGISLLQTLELEPGSVTRSIIGRAIEDVSKLF